MKNTLSELRELYGDKDLSFLKYQKHSFHYQYTSFELNITAIVDYDYEGSLYHTEVSWDDVKKLSDKSFLPSSIKIITPTETIEWCASE